jgi:tetratricopeptide (TPR) repeat protein
MTRSARKLPRTPLLTDRLLRAVLEAVLTAHRVGTLAPLCADHVNLARGLLRRLAAPVLWLVDIRDTATLAWAVEVFLAWGFEKARPDGQANAPIPRHAWFGATAWRPLLAVMAQSEFATVPDHPQRYRARKGEPPFEHLCGLWEIGPSSFYRYVERGREQLLGTLMVPLDTNKMVSLCEAATTAVCERESIVTAEGREDFHRLRLNAALQDRHYETALWHATQAGTADGVTQVLERGCNELAASPLTDALLGRLQRYALAPAPRVRLELAAASIARVRAAVDEEQRHLANALQWADELGDPLLLGAVYGAFGRFHEPRDVDKALAAFRTCLEYHEQALQDSADLAGPAAVGYLTYLVRLGFLYAQRSDPRSKAVLQRASEARARCDAPLDVQAMLEHACGEQYRREGQRPAAIECELRALQLYERSGNQQQILRACGTLVMLYGNDRNLDKATEYARQVFALAVRGPVDPQTLSATHLNLGAAFFWATQYDAAIAAYEEALRVATAASLKTLMGRAHYNLAEAFYKRFEQHGQPCDEQHGDTHVGLAKAIWALGGDKAAGEATTNLKRAVLGELDHLIYERMLPGELAAHFDEMSEIQIQRLRLGVPRTVDEQIAAHLRIAKAYTVIAVKEREAAMALIDRHGVQGRFAADVAGLKRTFDEALSQEATIAARWRGFAACPIPAERVETVVSQALREGGLSKSSYASVCEVSPATASKHLSALTQMGLMRQINRGPATRYLVVSAA